MSKRLVERVMCDLEGEAGANCSLEAIRICVGCDRDCCRHHSGEVVIGGGHEAGQLWHLCLACLSDHIPYLAQEK